MAKRRSNGEGNIRKRKDGRWEGRIIIGYDLRGKARYRSVYGHSYQEVKEKKNLLALSLRTEVNCSAGQGKEYLRLSFAQILEEWLNSRKDSIKESTYTQYAFMLHKYILPELGEQPLSALSSDMLSEFLKNKLCSGRADGKGGAVPENGCGYPFYSAAGNIICQGTEISMCRGYKNILS